MNCSQKKKKINNMNLENRQGEFNCMLTLNNWIEDSLHNMAKKTDIHLN